jgi:hypothetical protein
MSVPGPGLRSAQGPSDLKEPGALRLAHDAARTVDKVCSQQRRHLGNEPLVDDVGIRDPVISDMGDRREPELSIAVQEVSFTARHLVDGVCRILGAGKQHDDAHGQARVWSPV